MKPKFNCRDGFWLFAGIILGISLMLLWWTVGITAILQNLQIETLAIDLNETQMVETMIKYMNETGQLQ